MSKLDKEEKRKLTERLWDSYQQTLKDYFTVSDYYHKYELGNNHDLESNSALALNNVRQAQNTYLTALELELVRLNGRKWFKKRTYANVTLSNDVPF